MGYALHIHGEWRLKPVPSREMQPRTLGELDPAKCHALTTHAMQ